MAAFIPWATRPTDSAINDLAASAFVLAHFNSTESNKQLHTTDQVGAARTRNLTIHSHDGAPVTREVAFGLRTSLEYAEFRNALSVSEGSKGAFTRHTGFIDALEVAMYNADPVRRLSTVVRQSGAEVRRPGVDVSSIEGGIAGRDALTATPTFSELVLKKDNYVAQWVTSWDLRQDMAPNVATELATVLGTVLANRQNREFTTGNGGLCGTAYPVTSLGTAGSGTVSGDDLENLISAVSGYADPDKAVWMMSPTTWKILRKLKDGQGAYLYRDNKLADFRVVLNRAMPEIAQAASPVLFGDFSAHTIADTAEIKVTIKDQTLIQYNQLIWQAEQESAGGLLDCGTHPVARLVIA